MFNRFRSFVTGFGGTLLLFIVINLILAHLRSDCGLLGVLKLAGCADDISRAGFPLQVWQEGGYAYRHSFDVTALLFDLIIALGLSLGAGFVSHRFLKKSKNHEPG